MQLLLKAKLKSDWESEPLSEKLQYSLLVELSESIIEGSNSIFFDTKFYIKLNQVEKMPECIVLH